MVTCMLHADLIGDDYIWRWHTRIHAADNPSQLKAEFKQSTFFGAPLSPARLRKRAADHQPALGREGQIDRFLLAQMDGQTTLEEIARRAVRQFPDAFADLKSALTRAGELSVQYG